jgi:hypothetical protein
VGGYAPPASALVAEVSQSLDRAEQAGAGPTAPDLVGVAHAVLGRLAELMAGSDGDALASSPQALEVLAGLLNVKNRVDAAASRVVGGLDRSGLCHQATGTELTTWLMLKALLTRRQASSLVLGARRATRFAQVNRAAAAGSVSAVQARAIVDVLADLPADLDEPQRGAAERYLVELALSTAADGLARAGEDVLEQVAPEVAQQVGEDRARRQFERANRRRSLTIHTHADGVTTFSGSLPAVDGEFLRQVIDRAAEKRRRSQCQALGTAPVDRRAARIDALVEIAKHVQGCSQAAGLGAANTTLVLTMPLADLAGSDPAISGSGGRIASTGGRIDSRTLKTLACDSDVLRAVLGAKGEILDIGRATRAIPRQLRRALAVRDGGCAFPTCDRPVEACHIHHMKPWWQGGPTSLSNACTLCPTHHRMVEPPRGRPPDWVARLRDDGLPEFIPPKWIDPDQNPILHHRFRNRGATATKPSKTTDTDPPEGVDRR